MTLNCHVTAITIARLVKSYTSIAKMTKITQIGITMPHFEFCKNISLYPLPIIALNYDKCQMIIVTARILQ